MREYRYTWWKVLLAAFAIAILIEIVVTGITPEVIVVMAPIVYYTGIIAAPILIFLAVVWLIRKRNMDKVGRGIVWSAFYFWALIVVASVAILEWRTHNHGVDSNSATVGSTLGNPDS